MKISIKTVKGEILQVDCTETTTVAFLKEKALEKFKFEIETQKLIFRGKHLDDLKTLGELEIKDGDTIILMIIKVNSTENSSKTKGRPSATKTCSNHSHSTLKSTWIAPFSSTPTTACSSSKCWSWRTTRSQQWNRSRHATPRRHNHWTHGNGFRKREGQTGSDCCVLQQGSCCRLPH